MCLLCKLLSAAKARPYCISSWSCEGKEWCSCQEVKEAGSVWGGFVQKAGIDEGRIDRALAKQVWIAD